MTDYPPLLFLVLQALLTALLVVAPLLLLALGWGLFVSPSDALLALIAYLAFALASLLGFAPFEGDWAEVVFGPFAGLHSSILGGVGVALGMAWRRLGSPEGRAQLRAQPMWGLAAAFLGGAFWGGIWRLAGWCLTTIGVARDG